MSTTVPLKKPITAYDKEVSELVLREPTTDDIIEMGLPTLIVITDDEKPAIEIRQKVIAKYISKLASVPMSSVRKLSPGDFSACSAAVMGFFGQGDGEAAAPTVSQ